MSPPTILPAGSIKELAQSAAQINKEHQYALKVYTERLQAELDSVDKLLVRIPLVAVCEWLIHLNYSQWRNVRKTRAMVVPKGLSSSLDPKDLPDFYQA